LSNSRINLKYSEKIIKGEKGKIEYSIDYRKSYLIINLSKNLILKSSNINQRKSITVQKQNQQRKRTTVLN
jgi:hypothetical protein